jgi:hypothetical protein
MEYISFSRLDVFTQNSLGRDVYDLRVPTGIK